MSNEVTTYDPTRVNMIMAFVPISGFGEDDMIEFVPDEDGFTEIKGVDGDITCVKIVAVAGTLNITLSQSSKANAFLWAAYNADRLQNGGAGISPMFLQDGNGVGYVKTDTARIVRHPDIKFSKTPQPRVWKIRCYNYDAFEGGYAS